MPKLQQIDTGFVYVARHDARVLILGSMPGQRSLQTQQYYAHPRNAFWPIMGTIFGFDPAMDYGQRLQRLNDQHIALWDVACQCIRPGSLDANIRDVQSNDFHIFFSNFPHIRNVFFNGRKAENLFRSQVLPGLPASTRSYHLLPSTSPAYASMHFADKCVAWQRIQQALEKH